jgi:amidase
MPQESSVDDLPHLYSEQDALGLAECVRRGDVTPGELVEECIRRIEALNPKLNAVNHKLYDQGRRLAATELPDGPFRGVPFLLKDLMMEWRGMPVTNGCRYWKDYVASTDWEIALRMQRSGLIVVGKTSVPENGFSASTEPVLFGVTHNPWSEKVVAGGSSGGAAVAVASGMVPMADASDGGGSIRIPASINAVVGLKPSRGRTTMGPDVADCWYGAAVNLCVSRTVRDTAAFLDVIGGQLPGEPYALPAPMESFLSQVGKSPGRLRIGFVTKQPDGVALASDAAAAVSVAAKQCEKLGHHVEEIALRYELPVEAFMRTVSVLGVAGFEAAAASVGRPVRPADVEPVTWSLIERGRSVTGTQHANDIETLRKFGRRIVDLHAGHDVVITPTQPYPPRQLGTYGMADPDLDHYISMLMPDMTFTAALNFSGQPAITLPLYWTREGLPLGTQFVARIGDEVALLRLASQLEMALPWKMRRPPLSL